MRLMESTSRSRSLTEKPTHKNFDAVSLDGARGVMTRSDRKVFESVPNTGFGIPDSSQQPCTRLLLRVLAVQTDFKSDVMTED